LNLRAFASSVAGRLVFPLFTTFLLSFVHPVLFIHPTLLPSSQLVLFSQVFSLFTWNIWGTGFGYQKKEKRKKERKNKGKKKRPGAELKKNKKMESETKQPEIGAPHFLNQHCCF
jgi:hypothetical protein